ncbi:hypothetical protein ACEWY4_021153 [Coilia grayii]|uniref:HAT C-terminal dimerisation domain-containing protein n=1 Tax=Coilia grayii TaxID=363190 RepID=A0ABD1J9X2_9TELE
MILDDEPLSLVSKVGFRRTIQHLEPRYNMPSRHYILEKAIPQIHKDVRDDIAKQVESTNALSFTTDMWSCDHRPLSLLSLTAHWIGPDFSPKSTVLHAREFRGTHSANAITDAVEHMLRAWNIDKKKVHVILRDNAANIKKALDQLGVPSLGCFAHTLQLVVQHGLLAQRAVSDAIANGRKIVTHFKHSPKAYSELEDVEDELNIEPKRLQQDVKTRWSSTKMMIDSLLHCKRALQSYASDSASNLPATSNQWLLLEKTATVLKPFQELTAEVSAAAATAADVIPSVRALTRFLDNESEEHRGIQIMKATLLDAVHTRFDQVETEPLYAVATMLDPRYIDKFFTNATNLDQAKEALKVEVMKMEQELKTMHSGEGVAEVGMEAGSSTSSLSSYFDEILEESCRAGPSEQQITQGALFQLESYLSEPPIGRKNNPFHYWRDNQARLPTLAATAAKFLSAPCTSVESERLFSAVSLIIDEHRSRLTPEHLGMLVKKNFPTMLGLQSGQTVEGSV